MRIHRPTIYKVVWLNDKPTIWSIIISKHATEYNGSYKISGVSNMPCVTHDVNHQLSTHPTTLSLFHSSSADDKINPFPFRTSYRCLHGKIGPSRFLSILAYFRSDLLLGSLIEWRNSFFWSAARKRFKTAAENLQRYRCKTFPKKKLRHSWCANSLGP